MSPGADGELNPVAAPGVGEMEASSDEAFEAFLRERYGRVVAAVRVIVGDRSTAEDMAQEAFARAYINWSKLWPDGNPAGWVHRVAANLALSWRRRAGRELKAIARLGRRTDLTTPAPEAYPELHREVAALPPRQRAAVGLHYTLGLSIDETAEALGCRPGTVKSALHAARARLRERLGDDYREDRA
jgi:RNA polymerase sigma factor (sigma-70 family)